MRKEMVLVLSLFLAGCAVTMENASVKETGSGPRPLIKIEKVHPGMTIDEVKRTLGEEIIVGYELVDAKATSYKPIVVKNPVRTEAVNQGNSVYEVLYYFTNVKNPDGVISDEELTPLTFQSGKLIGSDRDFLFKLKNAKIGVKYLY